MGVTRDAVPLVPANVKAILVDISGSKETMTNNTLSIFERKALEEIVRKNVAKGKYIIEYPDYETDASDVAGNMVKFGNMINPRYSLKTLIGQGVIKDRGNGNYEVVDTYDFNDQGKGLGVVGDLRKRGPSPYNFFRSLGRNYGSADGMGAKMNFKVKVK